MPSIVEEHQTWEDVDGAPLVNAKIYVGVQNQDPVANPITIYSDRAFTNPIDNPQTTNAYGRAVSKIWVPGKYSIQVNDSAGNQVYSSLDSGGDAALGVSSGAWALISDSNIAAGANIDVEWDETTYHEVKLIIEDAEADTDNVVVYSRLGYDGKDAGTIRSTVGDYDSVWTNLTGASFSSPAATTDVQLTPPNLGSDVGEYFNAMISVRNFASANSGAYIEYDVLYHTTAGVIVPQKTFAAVIGFEEAYNWIRLYLSSGSWAANGTIKLYGLANS